MTAKEAFNEYKQTALDFAEGEYDNYSPYIKHGNNLLEIAPIIEQALTELEELKRDVNDYFRLHSYHYATLPKRSSVQKCKDYPEYDVEMKLFNRLFEKLSKVGEKDE